MKNRNLVFLKGILIATIVFLFTPTAFSKKAPKIKIDTTIANLEKAITKASDLYDSGNIQQGKPYIAIIAPKIKITFAKEKFDADLIKAFD